MKHAEHGDDVYRYENIRINFSSNIWGHADLDDLKERLIRKWDAVRHYPDPDAHRLECLLAGRLGILPQEVLVTNGATEAIYLIAELYAACEPCVAVPTFSEYAAAMRVKKKQTGNGRIHWICNPNNPTGEVVSPAALMEQFKNEQDIYVVDQAYEDYTLRPMLCDAEVVKLPHVLLLHSMTKKYCIPGLRLGYVTGHREQIAKLRAIKQPWSVNALAIEAGCWLCGKQVLPAAEWLRKKTEDFREGIRAIRGYIPLTTQTNFFLVKIETRLHPDSNSLKEQLAQEHGILIRDAQNFEGLDNSYIRLATQLPEENRELIELLRKL